MIEHATEVQVRWSDVDPAGIVGVPIVESGSTFVSPARYGDVLTISSRIVWVREKTFRVEHEISAGRGACGAPEGAPPRMGRTGAPELAFQGRDRSCSLVPPDRAFTRD